MFLSIKSSSTVYSKDLLKSKNKVPAIQIFKNNNCN